MYLLYLDESGTNPSDPNVCAAGVLIDGDQDWPKVNERIAELVERYVEPRSRLEFCFHATDIYHGSRYFDRRKPEWADPAKRNTVLVDLARIIADLSIPVMIGVYGRERSIPKLTEFPADQHTNALLSCAAMDCLIRAEAWLSENAPRKLATVIHEDGTRAKPLIKTAVKLCRTPEAMHLFDDGEGLMALLDLPLKRIIDTVHFADKPEARPLQLADVCAFLFARLFRKAHVPPEAAEILRVQSQWFIEWAERTRAVKLLGSPS